MNRTSLSLALVGTVGLLVLFLFSFAGIVGAGDFDLDAYRRFVFQGLVPRAPELTYSIHRTAPLEVARIFGRSSNGCNEASHELILLVAETAVRVGIDPRVFAAIVSVESSCNQFVISSRGAIGYTQVMPSIWKGKYDFADRYNLLNGRDNIHVGASILAGLIEEHGIREAVRRYQGLGVGCATCDVGYTDRIIKLSGRR